MEIKKLHKRIKKLEKKINHLENVTVFKSIRKNIISWVCIFIAIYFISNNYTTGLLTFFFLFIISYFLHIQSHEQKTFFTLAHQYHHANNNFYSHFIQYIIELGAPILFLFSYYLFGTIYFDKWVILFTAPFYSSIHNINYGYLKVNKVHSLHHSHPNTNVGPDICDILFGTKHPSDSNVEDTSHYIPNIIIIAICVILLKRYCNHDTLFTCISYFLILCAIIFLIFSLVLYKTCVPCNPKLSLLSTFMGGSMQYIVNA